MVTMLNVIIGLTFYPNVEGNFEGEVHPEKVVSPTFPLFHANSDAKFFPSDPHMSDGQLPIQTTEPSPSRYEVEGPSSWEAFKMRESRLMELLGEMRAQHEVFSTEHHHFTHADAERISSVIDEIFTLLGHHSGEEQGVHYPTLLSELWALHNQHPGLVDAAINGSHRNYLHAWAEENDVNTDTRGQPHDETLHRGDLQGGRDSPYPQGTPWPSSEHTSPDDTPDIGKVFAEDPPSTVGIHTHNDGKHDTAHSISLIHPTVSSSSVKISTCTLLSSDSTCATSVRGE